MRAKLKYFSIFLNNLIAREFNIRFTGHSLSTYINLSITSNLLFFIVDQMKV